MLLRKLIQKVKALQANYIKVEIQKPLVSEQTHTHRLICEQGSENSNRGVSEPSFDNSGEDDGRVGKLIKGNENQIDSEKLLEVLKNSEKYRALNVNEKEGLTKKVREKSQGKTFNLLDVKDEIDLSRTNLIEKAEFAGFVFPTKCNFSSAEFKGDANFSSAIFLDDVNFSSAEFGGDANFSSAIFLGNTNFSSAEFRGDANFNPAIFTKVVYFSSAIFYSEARFGYSKVNKYIHFDKAEFRTVPKISGISIIGAINFDDVIWPNLEALLNARESKALEVKHSNEKSLKFLYYALRYSQLKRLMNELHIHDWEIFFFRQELLCRSKHAKIKSKKIFDSNWRTHKFISLYDKICECGNSIVKPLKGLLALFLSMAYFYPFLAGKFKQENLMESFYIEEGIYLSLRHTVLFLPSSKKKYHSVMENLFAEYDAGNVDMLYIIYVLSSGVQTLLSIVLIFLIGLAIRNHLKIK
jgi:uncharacterized protein YjbI with pentapeptide repeats